MRRIVWVVVCGILVFDLNLSTEAAVTEEAQTPSMTTNATTSENSPFSMYYYAAFYGPALQNPSSYQPTQTGQNDFNHPVIMKNFLGLGFNLSDTIAITPTAYWIWTPVQGQQVALQDPFLQISDSSLVSTDHFNLYCDLRYHFPVTSVSQQNRSYGGVQSFQSATYQIGTSRFSLGSYASERVNFYGLSGYGNDLELYVAPNATYQVSRNVALTLLYEMRTAHFNGDDPFAFSSDPFDLEPGLSWEVTPTLMLNPYVNLYPTGNLSLKSSSIGMLFSWQLM